MNPVMKKNNKSVSVLIKPGRWPLSCLLFFYVSACTNSSAYQAYIPTREDSIKNERKIHRALGRIAAVSALIKSGDVVTRLGSDFTSECLRQINTRDKTWSHCGIASVEHDSVFVYHALGGEFNPDETIRRDYITVFADPANNRGIGIYRQKLDKTQTTQLLNITHKLYNNKTKFDMDFDLQTDERMYCAEFVYKAFLWSTNGRVQFDSSKIKDKVFIGVDDILLYPGCRNIEKLFYRQMQ